MSEIVSTASGNKIPGVLRGIKFIIFSYIVSVLLLAALSALIVYTAFPEKYAPVSVKGITLFGAFLSAFLTSRRAPGRGWLCGMINGACNVTLLAVLGVALFGGAVFEAANLTMILSGAGAGVLGGMLGINAGRG